MSLLVVIITVEDFIHCLSHGTIISLLRDVAQNSGNGFLLTSGSMFSVVASSLIDHHEALSNAWRKKFTKRVQRMIILGKLKDVFGNLEYRFQKNL